MEKLLSERMMALITIYTTKVTSMEETVQNCINYNYIISELYTKMNYIKRLESSSRTNHADYHQIFQFIDSLEIETNKILQEELLIKQLSESAKNPEEFMDGSINTVTSLETSTIIYSNETGVSKPKSSSDRIVFETSNSILEVDISMTDIIKGGTIISDEHKDKKTK